jgi:protein-tyrosine phosphatase
MAALPDRQPTFSVPIAAPEDENGVDMPSVLFVCTGNLHRSPMAEYLFKEKIDPSQDWQIESAGTYTRDGIPTTPKVLTVLQTYGIDANGHRSMEITRELIESHNLILCLASNHKEALRAEFPDLAGRVYLLSEMAGIQMDVEDPIGGPLVEFEAAAREIDEYLNKGFDRIVELAR